MSARPAVPNTASGRGAARPAGNGIPWRSRCRCARRPGGAVRHAVVQRMTDIRQGDQQRYHTGLKELDRVLGGGIVRGALMLIGGDPGIGKSTLLLQICAHLGTQLKILYVSGEESEGQIKLRADRLQVTTDKLYVLCENDMDTILQAVADEQPDILIVDSIQTMSLAAVASAARITWRSKT